MIDTTCDWIQSCRDLCVMALARHSVWYSDPKKDQKSNTLSNILAKTASNLEAKLCSSWWPLGEPVACWVTSTPGSSKLPKPHVLDLPNPGNLT